MSTQFPTVPALSGVPLIARNLTPSAVTAQTTTPGINLALTGQLGLPDTVVFGITPIFSSLNLQPFDPSYSFTGSINISPDSVMEIEVRPDSEIMSHPIEQGGFQAYNRVQEPIPIRLMLACQGKKMKRAEFLKALKSAREGTDLFTIATPDAAYQNMALKGYAYKQTAEHGAVTIWADTQWREARSTNVVVTSPPSAQPQGATMSNLGSLTPQTPNASTSSIIGAPAVTPALLPNSPSAEQIAGSGSPAATSGVFW